MNGGVLYILSGQGLEVGTSALQNLVDQAGPMEVRYLPVERFTARHAADAAFLFGFPDQILLSQAPGLQWLHLPSAGADRYADLSLYANDRVTLTTSAGVYGAPMAEHILMLFFALARGLVDPHTTSGTQRELYGATVALLGLGDVGRTLAARLSAFGATVLGMRRNLLDNKPPHVHELFDAHTLHLMLARADFVACCLPLTRETDRLLDAAAFHAMKPGAIFVNVGRGAVVDTEALVDALNAGHLWGAGLDVTDPEPLPANHPLRQMSNVILTNHSAGESWQTPQRILAFFEKQLARYLANRRLENMVDFFRGY